MENNLSNVAYYAMYAAETASTAIHEAACKMRETKFYRHEVKQIIDKMSCKSKIYTDEAEKAVIDVLDSVESVYYELENLLKPKSDLLRIAIKQELDNNKCQYSNELSYVLHALFLCEHSNEVIKAATTIVKRGNTSFGVKNGSFKVNIPRFENPVLDKSFEFAKLTKQLISILEKKVSHGTIDLNTPSIKKLTDSYVNLMFSTKSINKILK
jgi:polyhydroxyalkanoate synthesis regulator phasin